jgi:LemA protein
MLIVLLISFIVITALIIISFISIYNKFIKQKNQIKEASSGISVQLKRRYDLIPNLVNTVKGYSVHEKELLEKITSLRSEAMQTKNITDKVDTENQISVALSKFFAVAESYPDLKANTNFLSLQKELSSIENDIQLSRRYYNGTVKVYNSRIETFPSSIIASFFNFKEYEYFEISEQEATNPEVKF